jgi:hypothetical protein
MRGFRAAFGLSVVLLAAVSSSAVPSPQVASVGPEDATLFWRSDEPEPTRAAYRPAEPEDADGGWVEAGDGSVGRWHRVELTGLAPTTAYRFRLGESGPTGAFTTLEGGLGALEGMAYVLSDIHLCAERDCPDGSRRLSFTRAAYAAALADIAHRSADLAPDLPRRVVIAGDLVQWPGGADFEAAAEVPPGVPPICMVPGNHDRWARGRDEPDEALDVRLRALAARLGGEACAYDGSRGETELGRWRILLLDSTMPGDNLGEIGEDQLRWLDDRLAAAPDRPAVLVTHHPWLPHPATAFLGRGAAYAVLRDAAALSALLDRHPQVAAVVSGHLHVNWSGSRGDCRQLIVSALAQTPMGYHSLALHERGLVRRYHPLAETGEEALLSAADLEEWTRSRGVPLPGVVVEASLGTLSDRSLVIRTGTAAGAEAVPDPAATREDVGTAAPAGVRPAGGPDAGPGREAPAATEPATGASAPPEVRPAGGCRCGVPGGPDAPPAGLGLWLAAWVGSRVVRGGTRAKPGLRSVRPAGGSCCDGCDRRSASRAGRGPSGSLRPAS